MRFVVFFVAIFMVACEFPAPVVSVNPASADVPATDGPIAMAPPSGGPDLSETDHCDDGPPPYAGYSYPRLMTRLQFQNAVSDLLGADFINPVELPPENETAGFQNGVSHQSSPLLVELLLQSAAAAAHQAFKGGPLGQHPCTLATDAACVPEFIDDVLHRAFRRVPTTLESASFLSLYTDISAADTEPTAHASGLEAVITAVLQSPQFLYRIEVGKAAATGSDGTPDEDDSVLVVPLTSDEIASRLSFFLWNTIPDQELLDDAASGRLDTPEGRNAAVTRMVEDEKFQSTIRDFHRQWLELKEPSSWEKDTNAFPAYVPAMREKWAESILRFVTEEAFPSGEFRTLFRSRAVFLDGVLASIYETNGENPENGRYELPEEKRGGGLLTQPGMMAILAYQDQGSPIRRGVFLREHLLCETLPTPPQDAVIVPPDPDPSLTTRERFAAHTSEQSCKGCHELIDPIGFGFEAYDGLGRHRSTEAGVAIDESGELLYTSGGEEQLEGAFNGGVELAQRLAESTQVKKCYATQWFRYALGRLETEHDACNLGVLMERFAEHGDFSKLMIDITEMPAFLHRSRTGGTQ